jgi:hypothetical protein
LDDWVHAVKPNIRADTALNRKNRADIFYLPALYRMLTLYELKASIVFFPFSLAYLIFNFKTVKRKIKMNTMTFSTCAQACMACSLTCTTCAAACLDENAIEMMRACIQRCLECAEVCHLCAQAEQRKSPFMQEICDLCAQVCDSCAEECSQHKAEHCQQCAEACRQCANECRKMAA